jgi:DNA-binding MarR family transcriptional regulator
VRDDMTSVEIELAAALVRLSHLVQHVFADASRQHDLTPQQAQLLCRLAGGPVGMGELSRMLHLEKSSLTGLVDRVEQRGLVIRVRDAHDRRACQIALTSQGSELAVGCHQDVNSRLDKLAGDLPATDRDLLAGAIGHILTEDGQPVTVSSSGR